jgi:hypothetical protein
MELARKEPQKYEGKRYKVVRGSARGYNGDESKEIKLCSSGQMSTGFLAAYISSDTELEEIPQPVTFMEAVKAAIEGKHPTIMLDNIKHVMTADKSSYGEIGYWLKVKSENGITYGISTGMIDGMWTVEG